MRADPEHSPTKQAKIINQVVSLNGAEVQNHNPERENQTKPGRSKTKKQKSKKNRQIQITDRMSLRQLAGEARTGGR